MDASLFMDGVRGFFAIIDKAIFSLIGNIYDLMIEISSISIFSSDAINSFATRVYTFVGIIMLFKVTFSLISYMVNPDAINDKTTGGANLIKSILVTLVLIITVPFAFDLLYRAQSAIINDNLISKVVLGTNQDQSDTTTGDSLLTIDPQSNACGSITVTVHGTGNYMAMMAFRPFYRVYEDKTYSEHCQCQSVNCLLQGKYYNAETGSGTNLGEYYIDYSFFVSTACGIIILLLLLSFTMDIAVRTIKLGFYEVFAPIPIISYVDPKSGKDGIFKKWVNEVIKTWASLFVRLILINFVVYVIQLISEAVDANSDNGLWINLFLIIGALMFAKQAPKLLEDIAGIKFDGLSLRPIKKFQEQAMGGNAITQLPARAVAGGIGFGTALGGAIAGNRMKTSGVRTTNKDLSRSEKELRRLQRAYSNTLKTSGFGSEENIAYAEKIMQQKKVVAENRAKAVAAREKYEKETSKIGPDGERIPYFSAKHPAMAAAIQAMTGAKNGAFGKDPKLSKAIADGVDAAKSAVKRTNDFDRFGYMDRLRDLQTDITGVRNESGTTSIVKQHLKQQTETLHDIQNMINSMEHQFGNMPPGILDRRYNETSGKLDLSISGNYDFATAPSGITKDGVQSLIDQYYELRNAERAISKSNKEYEEVLSINSKK